MKVTSEEGRDRRGEVRGTERGWVQSGRRVVRILQWNADGIITKRAELEELLRRREVDVAVIQESKLGEKHKTPVFAGYTVVRRDREVVRRSRMGKGGGLLTLVKKDVPFSRRRDWRGRTTEGLQVYIDVSRGHRLLLTNVYRPPVRRIEGEDARDVESVRRWLCEQER